MISVSQLTKTYGDHILFENVTLTFRRVVVTVWSGPMARENLLF